MPVNAFIVEDSPPIREGLAEALSEMAGIRCVGFAANQPDAVAWLTDPANAWDLAIVDLILEPGGSGLGVLHALRDRPAGRKVVVLTATASPAVRAQCMTLGSDGVFDKAIETDALIAWCAALARGSDAGPAQPQAA